jgi:hypothetical protein
LKPTPNRPQVLRIAVKSLIQGVPGSPSPSGLLCGKAGAGRASSTPNRRFSPNRGGPPRGWGNPLFPLGLPLLPQLKVENSSLISIVHACPGVGGFGKLCGMGVYTNTATTACELPAAPLTCCSSGRRLCRRVCELVAVENPCSPERMCRWHMTLKINGFPQFPNSPTSTLPCGLRFFPFPSLSSASAPPRHGRPPKVTRSVSNSPIVNECL